MFLLYCLLAPDKCKRHDTCIALAERPGHGSEVVPNPTPSSAPQPTVADGTPAPNLSVPKTTMVDSTAAKTTTAANPFAPQTTVVDSTAANTTTAMNPFVSKPTVVLDQNLFALNPFMPKPLFALNPTPPNTTLPNPTPPNPAVATTGISNDPPQPVPPVVVPAFPPPLPAINMYPTADGLDFVVPPLGFDLLLNDFPMGSENTNEDTTNDVDVSPLNKNLPPNSNSLSPPPLPIQQTHEFFANVYSQTQAQPLPASTAFTPATYQQHASMAYHPSVQLVSYPEHSHQYP